MRLLSTLPTFLSFICCLTLNAQHANAPSNAAKGKSKDKSMAMELPYTALYSSQFQMADPKYSAIVLNAWKKYDDNMLDATKDFLADTMSATLPDGTVLKGRDSFIQRIKSFRGGFTSAKSEVVAYMSVRSIDKGDNIVFIWGTETDTKSDSTLQKTDLHEVWGFNKDGKVDFFKQFMSQSPKEENK